MVGLAWTNCRRKRKPVCYVMCAMCAMAAWGKKQEQQTGDGAGAMKKKVTGIVPGAVLLFGAADPLRPCSVA